MNLVRSGLGNYLDLSTTEAAILGVEVRDENAKLVDGIEIGHDGGAGVHVLFHIRAVHDEGIRELALAVDRDGSRIERSRGRKLGCAYVLNGLAGNRGLRRYPACRDNKSVLAATVQRNGCHLPPRDDFSELRIVRVKMHRGVHHGYVLGHRRKTERRIQGERIVGVENDVRTTIVSNPAAETVGVYLPTGSTGSR